jgi:peroxiredoxin Q/BCP
MYGREYEGIARCTYVIDENGVIEKAYPKVNVKTHAKDILAEL